MFKKPFNRRIGETRECKECGASFHTMKPKWSCNVCTNAKQKVIETRKRSRYEKKIPYPYQGPNHNYFQRFYPLRRKLHKMKVRVEWQAYFKEKLDEIMQDKILMKWINDRRDIETLEGKQAKSKRNIQRDYPNTHDYYEY